MNYDEFVGQAVNRLELSSRGEGVRAIRAVLTALAERLQEGEATDLAGALPMEIDYYVLAAEHGQRFDWDEFVSRVADRAGTDKADAAYYSQELIKLVEEAVPEGEFSDIRSNLPGEFDILFELAEAE